MAGLLFSIIISVSLVTVMVFAARRQIVRRYGFKVLYILSFILALRLLIPYSVQIPSVLRLNIVIPWWVLAVWGIGTAVSILCHTANYFYSRKRIMRYGKKCSDEDIISLLKEEKRKLFIDSDIPLIISKEVGSPMLVGMLSPVIVLPSAPYTDNEYSMIFRHELLHYQNKDSVKKLFFMLVVSVCWFNPFAYLLMRESSNSLECICDEGVLKNTDTQYKQDYCMMLLKTGNSKRFIPITSNLNTKEMLKMRISSIFDKKNKRSGGVLIVSVVLCLLLLSSFLCSCTVETPQDVIDEMERVESSIENEKETGNISIDMELRPVSEVTATARQTIDEWNSKDGIFKFDKCICIIPQVDKFDEHKLVRYVDADTAEKKYAKLIEMTNHWFGEGYFSDSDFRATEWSTSKRQNLDEYLESNDSRSTVVFDINNEESMLALFRASVEIRKPHYSEIASAVSENSSIHNEERIIKSIDLRTCTLSELEYEFQLIDGTVTAMEVAVCAESFGHNNIFSDKKYDYKASQINAYKNDNNQLLLEIIVDHYYDGIPFYQFVDIPDWGENNIDAADGGCLTSTSFYMVRKDNIDHARLYDVNVEFDAKESVEKILSVDQLLGLIKNKFSNNTVYNVKELSLGYTHIRPEEDNIEEIETMLVYYVVLKGNGMTIVIMVDAQTGDMNYYREYV